jgi:proton-dependent oligopeptide transporter, POT family
MESIAPASAAKPRLGRAFWMLNSIEMFERLAFFNLRVMAPIYIMQADNPGGLHLTATDKGVIYAWWAVFQSLLPIITGGLADRFGYKRVMAFAIAMMTTGYLMMATLRDLPYLSNYWTFLFAVLVMATGTAFFKPSIQGSLAHHLTKENSSIGWGIFYWVVNIGAFVGHQVPAMVFSVSKSLPGFLHGQDNSVEAWRNLFLASAAFSSMNFLLLLTFRDVSSGASKIESPLQVLRRTFVNLLEVRLLCWLVIMSCFWLMMYQLWDLQPNFIADWIDSGPLARALSWLPPFAYNMVAETKAHGPVIRQQVLLSCNAFFIILGVVGMSWLTRRLRTLTSMFAGMIFVTIGVLVAGWTQSAWVLLSGILCFSIGEMMVGPKNNQYLSLIAPPAKKGLYLGYVNMPAGFGIFFGSQLAGAIYGRYGEKATLALRYLAEKTPFGADKHWDGSLATLEESLGVLRPDAMEKLQNVTGMDPAAATRMLWDTYSPHYVWIPFVTIGVAAAFALWIFSRVARRWSDMNA